MPGKAHGMAIYVNPNPSKPQKPSFGRRPESSPRDSLKTWMGLGPGLRRDDGILEVPQFCDAMAAPLAAIAQPTIARLRRSIIRQMNGVKMSCMESSILPPGTTMVLARDMKESATMFSK